MRVGMDSDLSQNQISVRFKVKKPYLLVDNHENVNEETTMLHVRKIYSEYVHLWYE